MIDGHGGDDQIFGGAGNDGIQISTGNNTVFGEDGDDFVRSGSGDDTVDGGDGDDWLSVGHGADSVTGGLGNDTVYAGDGGAFIETGEGDDKVIAGEDAIIETGLGDDTVGAYDADLVTTGEGNDFVRARSSSATLVETGAGDDLLIGVFDTGAGATLSVGDGNDTIYNTSYGGNVNVGDDIIVEGGAGDDSIFGSGDFYGGEGNDVLNSHGHTFDYLEGGEGADKFGLQNGPYYGGTFDTIGDFNTAEDTLVLYTHDYDSGIEGLIFEQIETPEGPALEIYAEHDGEAVKLAEMSGLTLEDAADIQIDLLAS